MTHLLRHCIGIIAALLVTAQLSEAGERKLRIAAIVPLSGPVANLGTYVRNAVELGYRQLPAGEREGVELLIEDDQFDPKKTIAAYQRLDTSDALDVVIVVGSPTALALAPLTESKQQVLISIGGSDPNIAKGRTWTFIHWVTPPVLGRTLAAELLRRNFKRIGFVSATTSGAVADADGARQALKELGAEDRIIYNENFDLAETNYRSAIAALKSKGADAVVVVLFPGALSAFTKQAEQLQYPGEVIGMETFEDEHEVDAAGGTLNGRWYVNASDPTSEFALRYRQAYNEHPGWATANAYDALLLVVHSGRPGGAASVRRALAELGDYDGAAGRYRASGDNRFTLPAALKCVRGRTFITIGRSDECRRQ